MDLSQTLEHLRASGNYRAIPTEGSEGVIDLSSNDYLGLAADADIRRRLLEHALSHDLAVSSSASRLLSARQSEFSALEGLLEDMYPGRKALVFNSGYHANTGIVSALADRSTLVLADRLAHASIIDGIILSRAPFHRFRHNDYGHLAQLLADKGKDYANVLIIAESVYSMDGDRADIDALAEIRDSHPGAMLYIDEAHALGVEGPQGRGLVAASKLACKVDVIVGTFGKALASVGAFAAVAPAVREYLVNKARSFIFSTALPPVNAAWTRMLLEQMLGMDAERERLRALSARLAGILGSPFASHILPMMIGDAARAVEMSAKLLDRGVKALPIRTPTVPPGTERLRFSLSAALTDADMDKVEKAIREACSANS